MAEIITQKPIQVKKVSQLPDYLEHFEPHNLSLDNSYIMVAYPSTKNDMPHNYRLSLKDLTKLMTISINDAITNLQNSIAEFAVKLAELQEAIKNCKCSKEEIEQLTYYWNLTEEQFNELQETIVPWAPNNDTIKQIESEWRYLSNEYNTLIETT